jgi:hypothetical protein
MMRCPDCGGKLCGSTDKRQYGTYKSYRCSNRGFTCTNGSKHSELKIEKQLLDKLDEFLKGEIARVELEQTKPKPKPKTNIKTLKERQRRLTTVYMAGNISDDEYLKEDAELKTLIAKAEQEEPEKPKDITPLKELLETDFRSIYETLNDEDRQRFWQNLIKEIKIKDKRVIDVIFF